MACIISCAPGVGIGIRGNVAKAGVPNSGAGGVVLDGSLGRWFQVLPIASKLARRLDGEVGVEDRDARNADGAGLLVDGRGDFPVASTFGVVVVRGVGPFDTARVVMDGITVETMGAAFKQCGDGRSGTLRSPSSAGFGESGALRKGFPAAALFAKGDGADGEDVMSFTEASRGGGGDRCPIVGDDLVGRSDLVFDDAFSAGAAKAAVVAGDSSSDGERDTFGARARRGLVRWDVGKSWAEN